MNRGVLADDDSAMGESTIEVETTTLDACWAGLCFAKPDQDRRGRF